MALELRQKHLDAKLQVKDRPARVFQEALGGTSGPGPGGWKGYDGPQFSGRLEDLREFRRLGRVREAVLSEGAGRGARGDTAHPGTGAQG